MWTWKIYISQTDLALVAWLKSPVWDPLTLRQHFVSCGVYISSGGWICILFVTWPPQNRSVEMSCIFMCESSSQYVTTLKSLATIGILIIGGKSYKYVLPLKNWADWTITRQEKNVLTSKIYILARSAQKFKNHIFHLMTAFYNSALKIETSLENWMPMMLLCMFGIFILR